MIISALKELKTGRLVIHVQEQDSEDTKETLVFGTGQPEAEITVKSKNWWTRMVINADLARDPFLSSPVFHILAYSSFCLL
jgi:hypothetical protein